jgi:hypothetical protein
MKNLSFLVPLALALGAVSAAAEGPIEGNEVFQFQSTLSHADVRAQAVQAYRDHEIAQGEMGQPVHYPMGFMRSRSEVRAEAVQAERDGLIARGEILPMRAGA